MATDRDDEIARRYRALAREEPPAALDDAILARSRRAVGSRPGGMGRWGPPLSIAAVLVLASGVVIRMQAEKPGIETAAPAREEAVRAPSAPSAPAASAPEPQPPAAQKVAPKASPEPPAREPKRARPRPEALQTIPAAAPPPPAPFTPPMQLNAIPPSAYGAKATADVAGAAPRAVAKEAPRLKSEMRDARAAPGTPEFALERIAELRGAGRDDEADRALEEFRRTYPDYRLSDAQLEKVRRRAP